MDNANNEEVTLDTEAETETETEPEIQLQPEPGSTTVESDPAAEAFARLEGELALMRRAVQHLAAERADIVIPDYGATLTDMTKQLGAISESLDDIAVHPAMQLTREHLGARIEAVAVAARRADHERIDQASKEMRQTAQDMKAAITQVRTAAEQRRRLWQGAGWLSALVVLSRHHRPRRSREVVLAGADGSENDRRAVALGCRRTPHTDR